MHLFVFDDAVRKTDLKETIKLNIYDDHIFISSIMIRS